MTAYQRDFAERLRLGIVGAGSHAYRNILTTLTFLPVDLVAVCDVDPLRAASTAAQYGAAASYPNLTDMLAAEQLDAVLVSVSPALHPDLAIAALTAGVHVWLEKPAALGVAGVEDMLAARGDRVCVVGFKKAFMPATAKLREILANGSHDPVYTILATYPLSIPPASRVAVGQDADSSWLSDGCHPLAFLLEVGGPVTEVRAHRGAHGGGACILRFATGALGNLHLAHGAPLSQPFERYTVYANGATVTVENGDKVIYQRGIDFDYAQTTTFAPPGLAGGAMVWEAQHTLATLENKAVFVQGFYSELRYFCDCILSGTAAQRGSLEFALQVARVYEAALLSDGDPVRLTEGNPHDAAR